MFNKPLVGMSSKAVLTGDIVGSTKLSPERRQSLYQLFPTLSALLRERYPTEISHDLSNFRGDGWQLIVNSPQKAFEVSLFIRSYIRFTFKPEKLDTRIAVGIGPVQFVPDENISAGDGAAYVKSGRLLEVMAHQRMRIGFADDKKSLARASVDQVVSLLDYIISAWGSSQCQAVYWAMQRYKQNEIAQRWLPESISQASVSISLSRAGWDKVKNSMAFLEELIAAEI
jgi:hypothetical protein